VFAGKISDDGGGGFMMFMVDPAERIKLVEALRTLSGSVVNIHFTKHGAQAWRVGHL
jgi:D-glycero-alpha-D-manno-heptose-7-phosphate kinase